MGLEGGKKKWFREQELANFYNSGKRDVDRHRAV